jgi:hypothetical protein
MDGRAIRAWIDETFEQVVVADGFDDAILGVATGCGRPDTVIYDTAKVVEILVSQGMAEEEAQEYFSFNVEGAYVDGAPMYLVRPPEEEA